MRARRDWARLPRWLVVVLCVGVFALMIAIAAPGIHKTRQINAYHQCRENLAAIEAAKIEYELENKIQPSETIGLLELTDQTDFLETVPVCPTGGQYEVGVFGESPSCPIPGHELPEPSSLELPE